MSKWYLLYDGDSPDGRGDSEFVGRTKDEEAAKKHFLKCHANPYSTGGVHIISDDREMHVTSIDGVGRKWLDKEEKKEKGGTWILLPRPGDLPKFPDLPPLGWDDE